MAGQESYRGYLKQEFTELIDAASLTDLQKRFMKSRWLDQLLWLEGRAESSRNSYYRLRLVTIIGGVIIPALASLSLSQTEAHVVGWATFFLSQIVAISAAVEEFFRYGERYLRYRDTAENMKTEGWNFLQLSGPYDHYVNHGDAYTSFASRVETIIEHDVKGFVSQILRQQQPKESTKQRQPLDIQEPISPTPLGEGDESMEKSSVPEIPSTAGKPV